MSNWLKRAGKLMDEIEVYRDMAFTCRINGYDSLEKACSKRIADLDKKLTRLLKPHMGDVTVMGEISQADIDLANSHPIENLFPDAKKGKVLCIFHSDRNPSASIGKNNRFKCFSCGKSASVIDCYMKLNNKTFVESVRELK